jgi:superfamily II DNA or RNA helicase
MPAELQIDITRDKPIDDNQFEAELATIVENSFNIHPAGERLVFRREENPQAKLLAHAKNDKLFQNNEDVDHLAKEVRSVIGGPETVSRTYRVVVLKKKWDADPWSEFEEKDHPKNWDGRLPIVVVPVYPDKLEAALGNWLKTHLQTGRNTIRFLLPQKGTSNIYYDRELIVLSRAVYLALKWGETDAAYRPLRTKFAGELTDKLKSRFDRFAVLDEWNYAEPAKCRFEDRSHNAQGDKIPEAIDKIIKQHVFIPEEFENYVLLLAGNGESLGKLLKDLREPRSGGKPCVTWLGETDIKERAIRMCAAGQIAINLRGMELLQANPGETEDAAWMRMKGKLGTGKHLDDTTMYLNNWHRELNEVFNLNFEVFGSEGDVTDRKSNAFAKHDRLIASIDTLKRRARVRRLQEAPIWDLVVFDEAHHLTAYRSGGKVTRTENFKLAEVLKDHSRDLILLSATPHQGDHFRFWMMIALLNPTLFSSPVDMLENRHRLNSVVYRRTKADACRPDGSTLFAPRWVHTESFVMSDDERRFYNELNVYLMDGFALAKKQGNKGRALGFVMTIFQKIAASSFAAVHRTLRRRMIALTVQEGLMHDTNLDIDSRDAAFAEARKLIRREFNLGDDRLADVEAERILADMKRRLLKSMDEEELAVASSEFSSETVTTNAEDAVIGSVALALPEERVRIRALLERFPCGTETKVKKLIGALGTLWRQDQNEKVVIFATYLGSVEMLGEEIDKAYPGQGVVVLKGGDHGSKVAAERRFKQPSGPKVLICTAAGREGINLQHARVLFNFDLPWNPMDLEQRIGRIHRYGQRHTAQVYNLVLSDTIEGKIFLLLTDKLIEIAKTLGKVDEHGEVAENLRTQILGQLSERLNYESLYSQALNDPELKRTG